MGAYRANHKGTAKEHAWGILGHFSTLWWSKRYHTLHIYISFLVVYTSPHYGDLKLNYWLTRDMGCATSCCWSWSIETSTNNCWQCRRDCRKPWSNIVLGWKRFAIHKSHTHEFLVCFPFRFLFILPYWLIF